MLFGISSKTVHRWKKIPIIHIVAENNKLSNSFKKKHENCLKNGSIFSNGKRRNVPIFKKKVANFWKILARFEAYRQASKHWSVESIIRAFLYTFCILFLYPFVHFTLFLSFLPVSEEMAPFPWCLSICPDDFVISISFGVIWFRQISLDLKLMILVSIYWFQIWMKFLRFRYLFLDICKRYDYDRSVYKFRLRPNGISGN